MSKMIIATALALGSTFANAQALEARDFDGNGVTDAFYDAAQNLSWLADANVYATLGGPLNEPYWSVPSHRSYLEPGELRLQNAWSFLDGLVVAGIDGWRLPERLVPAGAPAGSNSQCSTTSCNPSATWPTELSIMLSGLTGASPFSNVMNGNYMTFSGGIGEPSYVQLTNPANGASFVTDETGLVWGYVWAVRDGDVGQPAATTAVAVTPVPEPGTYALMLSALLAVGALQRRRGANGSDDSAKASNGHANCNE